MKFFLSILMSLPLLAWSQDDHDHTHGDSDHHHGEAVETGVEASARMIAEAVSDKYEVVISYGHIHSSEETSLNVFVSDAETNAALDNIDLKVTAPLFNNE